MNEIPKVRTFPRGNGAPKTFNERFWQKVEKTNNCWYWIGFRNEHGYGMMKIPNRNRPERASRVSYQMHKGDIPDGMCVLHKCDQPACVNPDHLFLGSMSDNTDDMMKKDRCKRTKLTRDQVQEIRRRYKFRKCTHKMLAKEFGTNPMTVLRLLNGQSYRHV